MADRPWIPYGITFIEFGSAATCLELWLYRAVGHRWYATAYIYMECDIGDAYRMGPACLLSLFFVFPFLLYVCREVDRHRTVYGTPEALPAPEWKWIWIMEAMA